MAIAMRTGPATESIAATVVLLGALSVSHAHQVGGVLQEGGGGGGSCLRM